MSANPVSPASVATADPLAWWREARFGMFIHWGLYAVPAGIWKGQDTPGIGEWIMKVRDIPLAEYREFAKVFNPVEFDAAFIANLARDAGMKYLVITAKHHEGFAMWDSQASDYSIVKATPFKRDPLKELAQACRNAGIRLCFYYSQDLDWEHPHGGPHKRELMAGRDLDRYIAEKVKPQLRELLTNYGPIGLIWCDTPANVTPEQSRDIKAFIKSIQPDCLVSGRVGHGVGDYGSMGDNQIPLGQVTGDWETPATLNDTWGFKVNDHHWKSTATLVRLLVDLASKGVNYLLNIGPDALGRVPAPSVERLREIGAWLRVNGEAIYGTTAGPFPYEMDWGRMTRKGRRLYLIFYARPAGAFTFYGLRTAVKSARLLADGRDVALEQHAVPGAGFFATALTFRDAAPPRPELPVVVALECAEPPVADTGLFQQADGNVSLFAHMATVLIAGAVVPAPVFAMAPVSAAVAAESANSPKPPDHLHVARGGLLQHWTSTADHATWTFRVLRPARFRLRVRTVGPKHGTWAGGHRLRLEVGDHAVARTITADAVFESPRTHLFPERITEFGELSLPAGVHTLALRAEAIAPEIHNGVCCSGVFLEETRSPA